MKDEEIRALREQIAALNGLNSIQQMRIDSLLEANRERQIASSLSEQQKESYEKSIFDLTENTKRLISERDAARGQRWIYGVVGFGLGVLTSNRR